MATRTFQPGSKEAKPYEDLEKENKKAPKPLKRVRKGAAETPANDQEK